jgi:hypothetical protein
MVYFNARYGDERPALLRLKTYEPLQGSEQESVVG